MTQFGAATGENMDSFDAFKAMQKQGWAHFAPLEIHTTVPAAGLVKFAGVRTGDRVLDVACGTGVVAITAARMGAKVTGLDLTPQLLEHARQNAELAGVDVEWHEGDVEKLPFGDGAFDVVVSQFGHMFAPRPSVALNEMLRVLKSGGTIAFSTWPPELAMGRVFRLLASYSPPPPPGISPPPQWGDEKIVRERLGTTVRDIVFEPGTTYLPVLSPRHLRVMFERTAGPVIQLVDRLSANDPAKLAAFRNDFETLASELIDQNAVRQQYLMTRARKN